MKWGIGFASTDFSDAETAVALARAAEDAGFESLWAPQHAAAVLPSSVPEDRQGPATRQLPVAIADPLVWLSFVASQTTRIRLATGVLILPQHNPVLMAKATATLDHLSAGRVMLGIGVGDLVDEFAAIGVPFKGRGQRADEYIDAMRALWANDDASFEGRAVRFSHLASIPRPVRGAIPFHIGGMSDAAVARAGRRGDGFFPYIPAPLKVKEVLPDLLSRVAQHAREAGRDPSDIEITSGGPRTAEDARWFADAGVSRLIIGVRSKTIPEMRAELERFGDEVIAPTADL